MSTSKYPSVTERYFKKFYFKSSLSKGMGPDEDLCILAHSNRVCLVTLAPNHKALTEGPIKSVSYVINGKDFQNDNKANGKRKLHAFKMNPHTTICEVISGNGNKYKIKSGVYGKLLEVNAKLLDDPSLLNTMPDTNGYIAIVLHRYVQQSEDLCKHFLLTEEQYLDPGFVVHRNVPIQDVKNDKNDENDIELEPTIKEIINTDKQPA